MKKTKAIKINVPVLARVEGEGALDLTISNKKITELKLRIYEPPRYFEKFLEGRNYYDIPDSVARICGICPVAYQMSASHAIESVFNIKPTPWIRSMRRLFYCGEWIQSHSLHIHLLAAPDYFGFNSVIELSSQYAKEVNRGLKLQSLGNDLVALMGERSVHPVGVKIGGFTRAPEQKLIDDILQRVIEAKQDAIDLIHWVDSFNLADDSQDFVSVALRHDHEYPFNEGRIISDAGLNISIDEFEQHFKEFQVDHSTALHSKLNGKPYLVGPLARLNLNAEQLPEKIKSIMHGLKAQFPSKNMFHSIIARAIEIYYSLIEAESILKNYQPTDEPFINIKTQSGTGFGCTEAPRGILWHRYDLDKNGCVIKAVITPPTSQNQSRMEEDLKNSLISFGLEKDKHDLQLHAEKVIRNYDPCISCATHFLDLKLIRNDNTEHVTANTFKQAHLLFSQFNHIDLLKTAIIGIGSPQPNDILGWHTIDALKNNHILSSLESQGLSLMKLDRPGINLIEKLRPYNHILLIDALKQPSTNASFILMDAKRIESQKKPISSHETGLVESIELLKNMDLYPESILIMGVSFIDDEVIKCIEKLFDYKLNKLPHKT